jgi:hypothetical protein
MSIDSIPKKRCSKCGLEFPATAEYFPADKNNSSGLRANCRTCRLKQQAALIERRKDVVYDTATLKQCSSCGDTKPLTEFYKSALGLYGRRGKCKDCCARAIGQTPSPNLRADPSIPDGYKRCSRCRGVKPATLDFFPKANGREKYGVQSMCRNCRQEYNLNYNAQYRANNRERLSEQKRAYYQERKHDEDYKRRQSELRRTYRARNRQKIQEYNRHYRAANRGKRREYNRSFREKNPEYHLQYKRDWRARKPHKVLEYNLRRRTLRLKLDGQQNNFTQQDWERALAYFDNCCAVCGREADESRAIAADHWIPLNDPESLGTIPTNIVPLCHGRKGCNNSKCDNSPVFWLMDMFGIEKAKEILEKINTYFEWVKAQKDLL